MAYQPIEDYGIIGNMRTVALVGKNGSIDWMCYPHFDSPSIFAGILDENKGGAFQIVPTEEDYNSKQFYWPDTNVLITQFYTSGGVCEVTDYMPVDQETDGGGPNRLIRKVLVVRGKMTLRVLCHPVFNYAQEQPEIQVNKNAVTFDTESLGMILHSSIPMKACGQNAGVSGQLDLKECETAHFVLSRWEKDQGERARHFSFEREEVLFKNTVGYWRTWLRQCTYNGRWREQVYRSALTLKLLTFEPTGAIVAAPTCGLPEAIGGGRNWDYRYTWIRDAAFTIYGLMRIGFTQEAAKFMDFIEKRCQEKEEDGSIQVLYGINGEHQLDEKVLDHLEGYKKSSPVRIGNAAYKQLQLDIYGELMDSVYLYNKYGTPISYDFWKNLRQLINWNADNWHRKDEGIWETRGGRQHFVFSKLMSWVALDRGIRLAEKRSFPADRDKWYRIRDEIYLEIMEEGWSKERQSFVQYYGSDRLDASNLLMPLVFFLSPGDRRMLKMLDEMMKDPDKGGLTETSLVYRYDPDAPEDGLSGREGSFNICTFWMVEALTRAGQADPKRLEDARIMFEQMLGFSNHLGLYAEETGPRGEALGNFPQAFTHLALISAAYNLDRTLNQQHRD